MLNLPINQIYPCIQGEGKYTGIPHILIRFSGCRLRCQFKDSVCDTYKSSWTPEKGKYSMEDLEKFYEDNPHIKHTLISGGGPTLHKDLLPKIVDFCKSYDHFITIETEGSEFVQTNADFISLSPKTVNSVPRLNSFITEINRAVTQKDIDQHEKYRKNYSAMNDLITNHNDFQLKFVIDDIEKDIQEIELIQAELQVPNNKVYLMPEGVTNAQLNTKRKTVFEFCLKRGYNYSDRIHILMYENLDWV